MSQIFTDRYTVSDDQWADHLKRKARRFHDSLQEDLEEYDEGHEHNSATLAYIELEKTGCVQSYLDSARKNKHLATWQSVLSINPTRDFDQQIKNMGLFWDWLLEDPDSRILFPHLYDEPKLENYFWNNLGGLRNGGLISDPAISVRLFREIYGETYSPEIEFPYELGTTAWKPKKHIDSLDLFYRFIQSFDSYLFIPKLENHVSEGTVVAHLEYWFSMFPEVGTRFFSDEGYSTLFYDSDWRSRRDSDDLEEFARRQYWLRSFFGNLLGYNLRNDDELVVRNDPEVADYIWSRINEMELPEEFHQLIEFLHRHKDNALEASEGEPDPRTPFYKDPSIVELYEETDFILDLQDYCEQHGFEIDDSLWVHVQEGEQWEIEEGLFSVFNAYGKVGYVETGEAPESFLRMYTTQVLKLLECSSWKIESVVSKDSWESALVILKNENSAQNYELKISGIGGSDMVPQEFFKALNVFAELNLSKMFMTLWSDDAFLMLPLTGYQYYQLRDIISCYV